MYKILLLLLLLFGCLPEENWDPCNSKDPDSACYMPPPEASIRSYNPHSIIISDSIMNVNENVESISLLRITDGLALDSSFLVPILNNTYSFIDSVDLAKSYKYKLIYNGFYDDESDVDTTMELFHTYQGVDNLNIDVISEAEVDVIWNYDYFNNFEDTSKDTIKFKLTKYQLAEINVVDTSYISLSYPINTATNEYIYNDTLVSQDDQLQYSIYMIDEDLSSEYVTSEIDTINFPQCNISHHIPLNSHSIYLKWECDYVIDKLARIELSNQFNDQIFSIENADSEGYYKDDLNDYIELVSEEITDLDDLANIDVLYTLTWWGDGGGFSSSSKRLNTFPVHHMEYIPSLNSFNFGDSEEYQNDTTLISTRGFYIDKYEVNSFLAQNPGDNPYVKWENNPIVGGATYDQAIEFCDERTSEFESLFPELNLNFQLPNELDWEIAASAIYSDLIFDENNQIFNAEFIGKYFYPESVGNGQINCLYANIQSCFNQTTEIGFFSQENNQLNSASFSNIYDCSGNVKEWVLKYFNHTDDREILRGGDYNSNPNDAKSTSFIYEFPNIQHNSIGFRTIIDANEFIESINR